MPLGPMSTQGSDSRVQGPPSHLATRPERTVFQLAPPSSLTPASSPRAPPSFQRSCCQPAISRPGCDGSAATQGSISVAG